MSLYKVFTIFFIIGFFVLVNRAYPAVPRIEENITSQKFKYTRWKLIENVDISSGGTPSVSVDYDTRFSKGVAFQSNVVCPATTCETEIKVFGSVNGVEYSEIEEATQSSSGACNVIVNITNAYFRFFRLELTNSDVATATIDAWVSIKELI